jgi:S-DNA-T family DNA segregation ATPase FtsK/SpoIIIE
MTPGMQFAAGLAGAQAREKIGRPIGESRAGLLAAMLALAVAGVIALWVLAARFWRTSITLVVLLYLVLAGGIWLPVQLAAILAACLAGWRWRWPESFRRHVVPPVRAWLVRWGRYAPRWEMLTSRHGLVVYDAHPSRTLMGRGAQPIPYQPTTVVRATLKRVEWTPATDRLLVRLPAGLAPADVEKVSDSFAHATRSMACRVRPHKPGSVWIELLRRDPLVKPISALPIPKHPTLGPIPVGRREDGELWRLPVHGTHVLVAGATGSGKGSVLWSLLRGLAPTIANGQVEVWGFDPKGGMELSLGRALFTRVFTDDPESMADALDECADLMHQRAQALAGHTRLHQPTPAAPLRLVVIDELAALTALCERKTTQRVERALGRLLTQGRAPGCSLVAFLQDPGKDVIAYRNLFPTRVALRLGEAVETDMILGDGARARGANPHLINPATPGLGFIRHEVHPDPIRVRAAYVTDAQIKAMAISHAAGSRRPQLAALPSRITVTEPGRAAA